MNRKYKATIELDGGDAEVVVEYTHHKADNGGRDYPSSPSYIEVDTATHNGVDITDSLCKSQIEALQQEIEDDITAAREAAEECRAENRREEYLAMRVNRCLHGD